MRILSDPNPTLYCIEICESDSRDPRRDVAVPVSHKVGRPRKSDLENIHVARAILGGDHPVLDHATCHSGTKLFVRNRARGMDKLGAIQFFPARYWAVLKSEWEKRLCMESQSVFQKLQFGFDDVVPFMKRNYSSEYWFLVLQGAHAGSIGFWSDFRHDSEDWIYADSLDAAMDRMTTEFDRLESGIGLHVFSAGNLLSGRAARDNEHRRIKTLWAVRYSPDGA